jgi:hypothetical protein
MIAGWFNDPNGFAAPHFRRRRNGFDLCWPITFAESAFRQEMKRVFNVQQRAFDVTFRCAGSRPCDRFIGSIALPRTS